jgi:flagella basal body P-ring formation protein FlgA
MTRKSGFRAAVTGLALTGLLLSATPALSADISISGDWVLLGDVAAVTGPAATRPIAAAPLPGQRMPLSTEFIQAQASAAGYPVSLSPGEMIWVTRSAQTSLQSQRAATPPISYEMAPVDSGMPEAVDGKIPVLNTGVRRGDEITADMITFEDPDPRRRIQGLIHSPHILEDTEAKRTLRAGQPLSMNDIKPVSVVRKGDPVQLIYETGALRLIVSAKALSDAAQGETVRVVNLQSNRTMDAIAWAPGETRVGTPKLFQEG